MSSTLEYEIEAEYRTQLVAVGPDHKNLSIVIKVNEMHYNKA